jgi:nicotinamide-nucleotide amidase
MLSRIITIGDEILIGQITDTNSGWIAARLDDAGIQIAGMESVADAAGDIIRALESSLATADIVVITGGLGPTKDDITKKTLADYFGCGMREDAGAYRMIESMVAARGFEFNELNRSQALVPECCTVLPNRNGTAPGMWFEREGKVVVSLPGVPFEMKALMEEEVLPRLKAKFRLGSIVHKTMLTFGIAESMLAERIAAWEDALPAALKLAYLPNPSGVRLRLSSYDADERQARELIETYFAALHDIIPGHILGYEGASVEAMVAALLTEKGKTLSLAESCTGGYIAHLFTSMPGSSDYLSGGVVAYSYDIKEKILGVDRDYLEKHGAVNATVAEQMALGVQKLTGSDYAISTTGVAGPSQGGESEPVGTVWIGIAHSGGVITRKMTFGKLREPNIERASASAIDLLRQLLCGTLQ